MIITSHFLKTRILKPTLILPSSPLQIHCISHISLSNSIRKNILPPCKFPHFSLKFHPQKHSSPLQIPTFLSQIPFTKNMSSYGTIPTSTPPPDQTLASATEFVTRAKERIRTGLGTRRPWHEVLVPLSLPANFNEALSRLSINLNYFHMNYAILTVFTLFLSLLWHPGTLIVFLFMIGAWLFLYFLRDDPVVVFGQEVDDLVVLIGLCGVTFLMLVLTHASYNIAVGVGIGVLLALIHATFRGTDDLFLDHINAGGTTTMRQTV